MSCGVTAIAAGITAAAAVGGTAYSLSQGTPSIPKIPALPPSASPASLANAATSGAMINSRGKNAGAIGQGFDNTIATSPLGTNAPGTAKSQLLGGS